MTLFLSVKGDEYLLIIELEILRALARSRNSLQSFDVSFPAAIFSYNYPERIK
jgi:hypothetical protein